MRDQLPRHLLQMVTASSRPSQLALEAYIQLWVSLVALLIGNQVHMLMFRPLSPIPIPIASRPNDPFARRDTQPTSAARHPHQPQWQIPPTPPLSTSPSSSESHPDYYPAPGQNGHSYYGHAAPNVVRPARSHTDAQAMSPTVAASPASYNVLRSTHKQRPGATPSASAPMRVDTTPTEHILSACIGPGFNSNCITIAARKGNILDIVADRWDLEDCTLYPFRTPPSARN